MKTNQMTSKTGLALAALLFSGALLVTLTTTTAMAAETLSRTETKRLVIEEAERVGLPSSLALAVAKVESDFQARALSRNGALGVMQIHPQTASYRYSVAEDDLWEPRTNIQLGLDYLDHLITRYHGQWDLALSHYHSHFAAGSPLLTYVLPATSKYVDQVLRWQQRYENQSMVWADSDRHQPIPQDRFGSGFSGNDFAPPRHDNDMDDFKMDIEERRRNARPYLDDFSSIQPIVGLDQA